jgi:hypothetical protein
VSAEDFESLLSGGAGDAGVSSSSSKRIHPKQEFWLSKRTRMMKSGEKRSRRSQPEDRADEQQLDEQPTKTQRCSAKSRGSTPKRTTHKKRKQ